MTPLAKDSSAGLDLVIEKLERYANHLEKLLENKKRSGLTDNGISSQNQKHMADDVDVELERLRGLS